MKKVHVLSTMLLTVMVLSTFTSCKDEEVPEPTNEEELITTLTITFEDDATGAISSFTFRDVDGPGGAAPTTFDTIRLDAETNYHAYVTLLNESISPAEDITAEVEAEGDEHQIFYNVTGPNITFLYEDTDVNGDPIGLHTVAITHSAGTGSITITLKHQPGTKDGLITTGETDVEVSFVTEIN